MEKINYGKLNQNEVEPNVLSGYNFIITRPGGNDTCLINGIVRDPTERKRINDRIMKLFPNVEQVGFIELGNVSSELMMAGGEFCGNATRSTAYLSLRGRSGITRLRVSGVEGGLVAGITKEGDAFAQMPIYPNPKKITQIDKDRFLVEMQGIVHCVDFDTSRIQGLNPEEIKKMSMQEIKRLKLDQYPASGMMYVEKKGDQYILAPVVYVKEIDTLFYETACGSGTTALGLVLAKKQGSSIIDKPVIQPSGMPIKVSVRNDGESFTYAEIKGPIEILNTGKLESARDFDYIIEQITDKNRLNTLLQSSNLVSLYQEIFSKAPYFEKFSPEDVSAYFQEYVKDGILFLARTKDKIIGFGAALPINSVSEIKKLAVPYINKFYLGCPPSNIWYMADLGVDEEFRNQDIGKKLVKERLAYLRRWDSAALMRTSVDNDKSQKLYKSLNFTQLAGLIQEVEQQRVDGSVKKDKRIFFIRTVY